MESSTFVQPFLRHSAFEFRGRRFTVVIVPGSQKEGIFIVAMDGYWQAVMTSFKQELLGSCEFSLIPPDRLHAVISANPRLLLPTKSMVAYAKKQSQLTIFEWDAEAK